MLGNHFRMNVNKVLFCHPTVRKELCHVITYAIREDDHTSLPFLQIFGGFQCGCQGRSTAATFRRTKKEIFMSLLGFIISQICTRWY